MMMNFFSIFDPSTSFSYSMNWMVSVCLILFLPFSFWFIPSRYNLFIKSMFEMLYNEYKLLMLSKKNLYNMIIYITLFFMIMLNNFLGMFPYIFTSSSHLSMSLSFSLLMWISFMMFGWLKNLNHMFIHLVPQGTPSILMAFMVMIETISNLIRPGTLAVRLSANMIAGHLLITLISSTGPSLSIMLVSFVLLSQCLLIILELSVTIIQAYVFTVLSMLYSLETN